MFGRINKTYNCCVALLFICSPRKRVWVGWNNRSTWPTWQFSTYERVFWVNEPVFWTSLCVNPTLGQLDHLTQWVNKAVIPNKPVNEKTAPKIRKIMLIKLTCIEYFWNVESKNRIGPKKKSITINRFFHGSLQLWFYVHGFPLWIFFMDNFWHVSLWNITIFSSMSLLLPLTMCCGCYC